MSKISLQAFSAGVIFATAIIAGFYYGNNLNEKPTFTADQAKKFLETQGYSISKNTTQNESQLDEPLVEKEELTKNTLETEENKQVAKEEKVISYILKVKSKMTTSEIAELLEDEKIIDDATDFLNYMNKKDLSRKVQIGEFIVSSNMSYKELGNLLTK